MISSDNVLILLFAEMAGLNWRDAFRLWPIPTVVSAVIPVFIGGQRAMHGFMQCRTPMEKLRYRVMWYWNGYIFHSRALTLTVVLAGALWFQEFMLFEQGPGFVQFLQPFGFAFIGAVLTLEVCTNLKFQLRWHRDTPLVNWFYARKCALLLAAFLIGATIMGMMALAMAFWGPTARSTDALKSFATVAAAGIFAAPIFLHFTLRTETALFR